MELVYCMLTQLDGLDLKLVYNTFTCMLVWVCGYGYACMGYVSMGMWVWVPETALLEHTGATLISHGIHGVQLCVANTLPSY